MRRSLANGEYVELQRLAHKLKGAGGSYGYPYLTEISRVLEESAKLRDYSASFAAFEAIVASVQAIQNGLSSIPVVETSP